MEASDVRWKYGVRPLALNNRVQPPRLGSWEPPPSVAFDVPATIAEASTEHVGKTACPTDVPARVGQKLPANCLESCSELARILRTLGSMLDQILMHRTAYGRFLQAFAAGTCARAGGRHRAVVFCGVFLALGVD